MDDLAPLRRVDLKIYCQPDSDPATVRELILPLVKQYLQHPQTVHFKMELHGDDSICLYWPSQVAFSELFNYTPLVIKITVEKRTEDWPQLAFIRGFPVLGLRELIWEYKRYAGHIDENFTQRGLKKAIECLIDILTRFENPAAGKPWVRPGTPALVIAGPDPVPPPDPPRPDAEPPPPSIIRIAPDGDCLFAALAKGAEARGIGGHTVDSLRKAAADDLALPAYKASIEHTLTMIVNDLPQGNADDVLEAVGPRVGPHLRETMKR